MPKQRAFTIIELMVAIAIIAVMVGLLFPAIGAVRRAAKRQENNTKVRNIIQGMITYSSSHRDFFPGFDGFEFTTDSPDTTGNSGPGHTVEARYWILLDGNYTVGEGLISTAESKDIWQRDDVTTDNYSYAMMKIGGSTTSTDPFTSQSQDDRYRREEWRNEQNPLAPIVTDRIASQGLILPTAGVPTSYLSIHDGSIEGKWVGSIGRGDLSVEFVSDPKTSTRIAGYNNQSDDIFTAGDGTGTADEPLKNISVAYRRAGNPVGEVE